MGSFVEDFVRGIATLADVNMYRSRWSRYVDGTDDMTIYEYLGMSLYEYERSHGGESVFEMHAIRLSRQKEFGLLAA